MAGSGKGERALRTYDQLLAMARGVREGDILSSQQAQDNLRRINAEVRCSQCSLDALQKEAVLREVALSIAHLANHVVKQCDAPMKEYA